MSTARHVDSGAVARAVGRGRPRASVADRGPPGRDSGISWQGDEQPFQLLVAVTDIDPP
ncbi:hypothetical protein [Streptomyces sp. NBC_01506]|uniref:hypothetical protein n=1 Tax=Streptomyces sp. NBC_01506 TaxID=2903887 RepID=UPI00386320BA